MQFVPESDRPSARLPKSPKTSEVSDRVRTLVPVAHVLANVATEQLHDGCNRPSTSLQSRVRWRGIPGWSGKSGPALDLWGHGA